MSQGTPPLYMDEISEALRDAVQNVYSSIEAEIGSTLATEPPMFMYSNPTTFFPVKLRKLFLVVVKLTKEENHFLVIKTLNSILEIKL